MKKIDTIIFDLDGTLLDTLDDLKNSVVYVQEKYGFPVHDRDTVRSHVGGGIKNLISRSVPVPMEEPLFDAILGDFKEHYGIHCNDLTKPYEGILELLAVLKEEGYKMSIVSNKADFAVKNLNKLHFSDYIEIAIGENEAAGIKKKPAPDTIYEALKQMDSTQEQSVYIGDSEVDILTAANSNMPCVLCEWGFRDKKDLVEQGGTIFAEKAMDILEEVKKL